MKRNEQLFINDILESIFYIENFSKGVTKVEFLTNRMRHDAIIRNIEIIGEAVKNISNETKDKYPDIEWKKISGTRDIFSHVYFGIVLDRVWDIVKNNLPELREKILEIKKDLEISSGD